MPDSASRPAHVFNFEGAETVFTYKGASGSPTDLVETISAPGGIVSSFTYDTRGRLLTAHPAS